MAMIVTFQGLDKLQGKLKKGATMRHVKDAVAKNGSDMQKKAQRNAPVDTGTLKRSIGLNMKDGGLTAEVEATAEYAPYVEHGTRFMAAQPFIGPAFVEQSKKFLSDAKRLVE